MGSTSSLSAYRQILLKMSGLTPVPHSLAIPRNDVRNTARVRRPKSSEAALGHARTGLARELMVFDREFEPTCHEVRSQLAKTQSFGDRRGQNDGRDGRPIVMALAQLHCPCPRPLNHEFHLFWFPRFRSIRLRNALCRKRRDGGASGQ